MKKVLLGVVLALVLCGGGCFAMFGAAVNEADKAIKEEERNDAPTAVAVGKAFTHDDWAVAAGWKLRKDGLGSAEVVADVTNKGDDARTALLTIKVLRGTRVLADITCSTDELEPGQSAAMSCFSSDDFPAKYGKVTVEDTL